MSHIETADGRSGHAWSVVSLRNLSLLPELDAHAGGGARGGPVDAQQLRPRSVSQRPLPILRSTANLPPLGVDPSPSPCRSRRRADVTRSTFCDSIPDLEETSCAYACWLRPRSC
jgi:hypothetical protein